MPASNLSACSRLTLKVTSRFCALVTFTSLVLLLLANSVAGSPPGQWGPPQKWPATAVHLMLLPGDDLPYRARVLWFQEEDPGPVVVGGLWDWRTGQDGCSAYPSASFDALGLPAANADIFCAGAAHMESKFFVAGGTEPGTENGISDARIFQPRNRNWDRELEPGSFDARAAMVPDRHGPARRWWCGRPHAGHQRIQV